MTDAVIARKQPFDVDVADGKEYWWCACGRSESQPFCDGSHKGTGFTPVRYVAEATRTVFFCGCKRTANQPLCDGTHNTL